MIQKVEVQIELVLALVGQKLAFALADLHCALLDLHSNTRRKFRLP